MQYRFTNPRPLVRIGTLARTARRYSRGALAIGMRRRAASAAVRGEIARLVGAGRARRATPSEYSRGADPNG